MIASDHVVLFVFSPKDIMIYDEESDRHVHISFQQALYATCYGATNGPVGDLFNLAELGKMSAEKKCAFNSGKSEKEWVDLGVAAAKDKTPKSAQDIVDALIAAVDAGQWVPVELVIARPFIEHLMLSAVVAVAGRDTGATLFGPADMQISANTSVKTIEGTQTSTKQRTPCLNTMLPQCSPSLSLSCSQATTPASTPHSPHP